MNGTKALLLDERGAIAPTFALSLFALVAVGGIAFDYARLAAMDSELQNAADQAALAAASQLDGQAGACSRASAAIAAAGLVSNSTLFANDGNASGIAVTVPSEPACDATGRIRFYQDKAKATASTSDANANYVEVQVNARTANYALTPIVGAISSGAIDATAFAGLGAAICKVPPVMICNLNEGGDPQFTTSNYIGKGLKLVSVGNGGGAWQSGNFGYLNTDAGSNGAPGLRESLGWTEAPGNCQKSSGVDTKPGASVSVTDALNTRFDIYDNQSCPTGGVCPASINSVKDLLRANNANGNNACRMHNSGWQEASPSNKLYLPNTANALTPTTLTPDSMGHPRDMCHAANSGATNYCSGPVGTAAWDRDAYFRANYGWNNSQWQANLQLGTNPVPSSDVASVTRYKVYKWEIDNRGTTIGGAAILPDPANSRAIGSMRDHDRPICGALQTPSYGTGTVPGGSSVDRRRLSVAVVNCSNAANNGTGPVNGSATNVKVTKWIEVFLVEPSFNRGADSSGSHSRSGTGTGDIYVEVIGETLSGGNGATAGQVIRKDVPYLIE